MTEEEILKEAVLPEGYAIDKRGLWELRVVYDRRTDTPRVSRVYLSFAPIWLVSNAKCLDTLDGHLVIRYLDGGVVREQVIKRGLLFGGSIGGALGGKFNFALWPREANNFGNYLLLADKQCRKTEYYRPVTGWNDTDRGPRFALYGDNDILIKASAGGMQQKLDACVSSGDRDVFVDAAFNAMVANPLACVPFMGAIAAPMLSRVGAASMTIDICGGSSNGKTVIAAMSMAVFGNPYLLESKWSGPAGGLGELLSTFRDMPVHLDEAQAQNRKNIIWEMIYDAGNGVATLRGKPQGGTQAVRRRKNMIISTSEAGLMSLSEKGYGGIDARLLLVEGAPLDNYSTDQVRNLESVIQNNYGLVGKDLISHLESSADFQKIQREHKDYTNMLLKYVKNVDRIQGRKAKTYAVLLCAVDVLVALYPNRKDDLDIIKGHLTEHWKKLCDCRGVEDNAHLAFRALMNFYLRHIPEFGVCKRPLGKMYSGNFGDMNPGKVELIGFLEETWEAVLRKVQCDPNDIVRQFCQRGWILYKESPKWKKLDHRVRTKLNTVETDLIVLSQLGRDAFNKAGAEE